MTDRFRKKYRELNVMDKALVERIERHRRLWDSDREKVRAQARIRHGLPEPTRPEADACELCGEKGKQLNLDHDHNTGAFRGWLCTKCNTGLGKIGDSPDELLRAVAYLRGEWIHT